MKPKKPIQCVETNNFDDLPNSALVRITDLVRSPKNKHKVAPLPISAATVWRKVANGTFPAPMKFGARIACWKVEAIRTWLDAQANSDKEAM
ncbi:AlpA family phage regulatory protein [Comamonas aquatica]|uniref:helix-turn-helix transcriptional regulator n=1 Tax=Comamonas aquatica TaxID=225991 RepID=UPI00244A1CA6|nr:AlpA family phage regulatory protein [Comamonas aquatica]MDH1903596.1 AlpA family phage regulatory protein [Comamonas aquatica]